MKANDKSNRKRYSDIELEEFRQIIQAKIDVKNEDIRILKESKTNGNSTNDTDSKFHNEESGRDTLSNEENIRLIGRLEDHIKKLEAALIRIAQKDYGICIKTGKLISKERLRLVPATTQSIEAKNETAK